MSESGVVLITGCSHGSGGQLPEPLARRGYLVHATTRHATSTNADAFARLLLLLQEASDA